VRPQRTPQRDIASAVELRAQAAKATDRAIRETLLKAADACDEMATWQPYRVSKSGEEI
jgi:hypothetical protein